MWPITSFITTPNMAAANSFTISSKRERVSSSFMLDAMFSISCASPFILPSSMSVILSSARDAVARTMPSNSAAIDDNADRTS